MFEDIDKEEMRTGSLDLRHDRSTKLIAEPETTSPQNEYCSRQNGMNGGAE